MEELWNQSYKFWLDCKTLIEFSLINFDEVTKLHCMLLISSKAYLLASFQNFKCNLEAVHEVKCTVLKACEALSRFVPEKLSKFIALESANV